MSLALALLCSALGLVIACQPWLMRRLLTLWRRDAFLRQQPSVTLDPLRRHWPKAVLVLLIGHLLVLLGSIMVFGWSPHAVLLIGLGAATFVLAVVDWRSLWLPDAVVIPLAGLGILVNWLAGTPMILTLLGAAIGYGLMALLRFGYRRLRGVEGLGGGDVHLAAAMGAWLGFELLPLALFFASASAIAVALPLFGFLKAGSSRLPFGTFMAMSLFASYALIAPVLL